MFEKEEKQLQELGEHYNEMKIPDEIDEYILRGITQAKKKKQSRKRFMVGALVASVFIAFFLTSIRVSPTFANYVSHIPGLEKIVELVRFDKGLLSAIDNDLMQEVNVSDKHEGLEITVDAVIVDEQKMVLFYSLESDRDREQEFISLVNVSFGEKLPLAGISYGSIHENLKKGVPVSGSIDFYFDGDIPEQLTLSLGIETGESEKLASTWTLPFSIDKEKFAGLKEEIQLNETVEVEGQKVTFEKITILPTRVAVHVKYDENNSKELFTFEDLRLVDEKGEQWSGIANGITAQHISENEKILYLQSNYFNQPEELYLVFSSIRALDKDELEVVVDLENKMILKAPADGLLTNDVEKNGGDLVFWLSLTEEDDANMGYSLFDHEYKDSEGNVFHSNTSSTGTNHEEKTQRIGFVLENGEHLSPITLTIQDYPSRIKKDVRIQVK